MGPNLRHFFSLVFFHLPSLFLPSDWPTLISILSNSPPPVPGTFPPFDPHRAPGEQRVQLKLPSLPNPCTESIVVLYIYLYVTTACTVIIHPHLEITIPPQLFCTPEPQQNEKKRKVRQSNALVVHKATTAEDIDSISKFTSA